MWAPKGCVRCGGDLYKTMSEDGLVATCLQCGHESLERPRRPEMSQAEIQRLFHEPERPKAA